MKILFKVDLQLKDRREGGRREGGKEGGRPGGEERGTNNSFRAKQSVIDA